MTCQNLLMMPKLLRIGKKKNEDGSEEIFHLQSGLNVK